LEASKKALENGIPTDIECAEGIHLFAVPNHLDNEIIGAINFGHGEPPQSPEKLDEIARKYQVDIKELTRLAYEYQKRPQFIIDLAKNRLVDTANLIGLLVGRKKSEEERIQLIEREHEAHSGAEVAKKLDRMRSMFLAATSHELRTPLNSIIGFTSLILDGTSGELNPDQKEQLEIVHSSGKYLLVLINDIIDVSKIDSGKKNVEVSEFNLGEVFEEVSSSLRIILKDKKLELKVDMGDIVMKSDRRRLFQCLINLLSNAIKFTENGNVVITAKVTNNNVGITVTDTGIGIKTEDIPKLFAPFVRLQTLLTAKTSGTGLGLYLVKKIAKDFLGGDVEVESEFGKGSKFTLRVPVELEGKD
jgi:signal transduction histidine kinase